MMQPQMPRPIRLLVPLALAVAAITALAGAADPPKDSHKQPAKPAAKPGKAMPKPPEPVDPDEHAAEQVEQPVQDAHAATPAPSEPAQVLTADEALSTLREGNARWCDDQPRNPNTGPERRRAAAEEGQKPFATILTCADSRLPVERIFDRGVGELFVLRVAGNIVTAEEAGTVEYGAEHLHVPLLVVMGHTRCGAVQAAAEGASPGGNIDALLARIAPAVERARRADGSLEGAALAAAAVRENVWQSVFDLIRTSSLARELIRDGRLRVVGAVCDVSTGRVEWLGEHPWQSALVDAFDARENAPTLTREPDADHH